MRILMLAHAFNSLAQRLWVELEARGHALSLEFDIHEQVTLEAAQRFDPELILAPFMKRRIPAAVWRRWRTLIVHPGIEGDRGPSSLDWAIQEGERDWGVTVIEAAEAFDAGDIWAAERFEMRPAAKSSLYRNEVTEAAVRAVLAALARLGDPAFRPRPLAAVGGATRGRERPAMRQADRRIDWRRDPSAVVLRKIHAADGHPGVADTLFGEPVFLHGAHAEDALRGGVPGEPFARRDGAVLVATVDGAVWITHLRRAGPPPGLKLSAGRAFPGPVGRLPEVPLALEARSAGRTWREIRYEEHGEVGALHFAFHNGAMDRLQCERLREALARAKARPTKVIVLMGGEDFWSNGIHLNVIEAAEAPADESWANINAIDDLALEILGAGRQLTIAALQGNAGAGGVFLALAADRVIAREGVVLNPHYKGMGNLFGSEYWTYLLPRRVGAARAEAITQGRLPLGAGEAARIGLMDGCLPGDPAAFRAAVLAEAAALARDPAFGARLSGKRAARARDEAQKPLAAYRAEELARMKLNFYGFDPSYHVARHHFVHKLPRSRTPLYLARHRASAPA
jgi:putative two-component system hydrogenase maturation factor HypX/HoxX